MESFEDKIRKTLEDYEAPYHKSDWNSYAKAYPAAASGQLSPWLPYLFSLGLFALAFLLFRPVSQWLYQDDALSSSLPSQGISAVPDTVYLQKTIYIKDTLVIRDTLFIVYQGTQPRHLTGQSGHFSSAPSQQPVRTAKRADQDAQTGFRQNPTSDLQPSHTDNRASKPATKDSISTIAEHQHGLPAINRDAAEHDATSSDQYAGPIILSKETASVNDQDQVTPDSKASKGEELMADSLNIGDQSEGAISKLRDSILQNSSISDTQEAGLEDALSQNQSSDEEGTSEKTDEEKQAEEDADEEVMPERKSSKPKVYVYAGPTATVFTPLGSRNFDTYGGGFAGGHLAIGLGAVKLSVAPQYGFLSNEYDDLDELSEAQINSFPSSGSLPFVPESIELTSQHILIPVDVQVALFEVGKFRPGIGVGLLGNVLLNEHFTYAILDGEREFRASTREGRAGLALSHVNANLGVSYQWKPKLQLTAQSSYYMPMRSIGIGQVDAAALSLQLGLSWMM